MDDNFLWSEVWSSQGLRHQYLSVSTCQNVYLHVVDTFKQNMTLSGLHVEHWTSEIYLKHFILCNSNKDVIRSFLTKSIKILYFWNNLDENFCAKNLLAVLMFHCTVYTTLKKCMFCWDILLEYELKWCDHLSSVS